MQFDNRGKLILGLFSGLIVLSVLVFACAFLFFPTAYSSIKDSNSLNPTTDEAESPSYGGMGTDGKVVDGRDLIYPPVTSTGGDGSKLVKSSSISISVTDLDNSTNAIKSLVTEKKGFVQSLTDSGTDNDRSVTISIRVPSSSFDEVLTKVKALGAEVLKVSEGSDDISETYADTKARLKTQKALEQQLLTLLNRATKISDILEIQTQLTNVRTQIEMYESLIKNFDSQVDMSVVYISMTKASEAISVTGDSWRPVGVFKEALSALVALGKGLVNLTIWAIVFSPLVLIPAGLIWLPMRKKSRK